MALAATLGGMAFSNVGVAVVHALEYPIGGATHCSHGAGNGLLLPYVMRYNLPGREREFARIGELLGEDTTGLSPTEAAEQAITAVERLRAAIGIPTPERNWGIKESQLRLVRREGVRDQAGHPARPTRRAEVTVEAAPRASCGRAA